jgi:hypothetical protein
MAKWRQLMDRAGRGVRARRDGEEDAPADLTESRSRDSGGEPDRSTQDRHSTTGTTPSEEFVGRDSGDETGDTGTSGAERRAGRDGTEAEGALRDEG